MKQTIVALTGISGVGKTSFLRAAAKEVEFQHLTGGSLIAAGRASSSAGNRDKLRHADLEENQRLLVVGFEQERDHDCPLVVMDGHVIIDAGEGISEIDSNVFLALRVKLMVHLEAEPSQILDNRLGDEMRKRPALSVNDLRVHQDRSRRRASDVAASLEIGFVRVTHTDITSFVGRMMQLRHAGC